MLCEQCLCCNRRSLTLTEHSAVSVPGSLTVNVQSVQSCAHTSGQNRYEHQQETTAHMLRITRHRDAALGPNP